MTIRNLVRVISAFLLSPAVAALAQQAQDAAPKDVMMPKQSSALVWVAGFGLLFCVLIAGFKHPGRTHLD